MKSADLGKIFSGPAGYALAIGAGGLVLYMLWNKFKGAGAAVASAAGGVVSGNNAITQNTWDWGGNPVTAYQGKGIAGTLGAATNTASGGLFSSIGDWISGAVASVTMPYNPNSTTPSTTASDTAAALPSTGIDTNVWSSQGNGW